MINQEQLNNRRRIVIHHTHLLNDQICKNLKMNDIVFFDDCLFSQYVFIKKNIQFFIDNKIDCILGFSSGLYANENEKQTYEIKSYVIHDICNKNISTIDDADRLRSVLPEMNGFMNISQIKEIIRFPNAYLALHGCCHLKLNDEKDIFNKFIKFNKDVTDGISRLEKIALNTNMFIYPYVYSFAMSDFILKKHRFSSIIGSKIFRISIEDLIFRKMNYVS